MTNPRLLRPLRAGWLALAAAMALAAAPAAAADLWQAYTYWGSPTVVASKGFRKTVEDIEQASGGALKVKFNLGGTLSIAATNIASAVADDIIQVADDAFYQGTVPIAGMTSLPFIATSVADVHKMMGIVRPLAERDFAKRGVTVLGYYVYPQQVFWFRDSVTSLAQVKGRKVRVSSPEQGDMIRRFGGTPVQIGSAEVPAALERGIVDGILTASAGGIAAWKDLLKSSYVLGMNYHVAYILANTSRFQKLAPDAQAKVRAVVTRNMTAQTAELEHEDGELRKKFAAEGITMTAAKREDVVHGEQLAKESWEAWAKARGPEAIDALAKARAALGR